MSEPIGCQSRWCIINAPEGLGVNGPCTCAGGRGQREIVRLQEEIARLREENERLRETTIAPGSNDEWMRLFGVVWYREDIYQRAISDVARERDEARALAERWRDAMGASPESGNPLPWELEPSDPGQHVPHKRWLPEFE